MLEGLKAILDNEGLMNKARDFESRYSSAIRNKEVRRILDIETPIISDLTEIFQIENKGKLYAIRMDLNKEVDNHKKPIVAGLILRNVLQGEIPQERKNTLIDGGNYNSAKALKYYSKRFDMKGIYVMSRLFSQLPSVIKELNSKHFNIELAPKVPGQAVEAEFYEYLFNNMKKEEFRKNKVCLWHAKYSGKAMYPLGREIAESLDEIPDCFVSCLGAGSTLDGVQIAAQDYFTERNGNKPEIIVAEHELSPLFSKFIPTEKSKGAPECTRGIKDNFDPENFYKKIDGLSHMVIGPHYDEINPLINKDSISRISRVVQYSNQDCIITQKYLKEKGIDVGNSSAANLNVSANMANQGLKVLTVIFEPFRWFYKN